MEYFVSALNEPAQSSPASPAPSVDLNSLYSRAAFVTDTADFLAEEDTCKALTYWLKEFSNVQTIQSEDDILLAIHSNIAHLDHLINDQLNSIIHHPSFQKLEASWRGIRYLVNQAEGSRNIKIRM